MRVVDFVQNGATKTELSLMQLIRFGAKGREKPGILATDGSRRDLSAEFRDWDSTFFACEGLRHLHEVLQQAPSELWPEVPST